MIKKIGILTSGGDAPGMNNALRAVALAAFSANLEVAIIRDGYKGLIENNIELATSQTFCNILSHGGTFLRSARVPEFDQPKVRAKGISNLKKHNIDSLVVIGGDGSYKGALRLTEEGVNCIGLPGTIDNDIESSDYTIGFYTALNTIVEAIDKLRDTSNSHSRCTIIEVMGRHCGDLAIHASIASGADIVSTPEKTLTEEQIFDFLNSKKQNQKRNPIIIVTEKLYDVQKLAKNVQTFTRFETRAVVLGHIQRGGTPSPFDRILAARLGVSAIELLLQGKGGLALGIINNKIVATPISNQNNSNKELFNELFKINEKLI